MTHDALTSTHFSYPRVTPTGCRKAVPLQYTTQKCLWLRLRPTFSTNRRTYVRFIVSSVFGYVVLNILSGMLLLFNCLSLNHYHKYIINSFISHVIYSIRRDLLVLKRVRQDEEFGSINISHVVNQNLLNT